MSLFKRQRGRCRLGNVDTTLLVNLELIDLVLERVEVDLVESPLTRCAGRQRERGLWVRRDADVSTTLLLGRWMRGGCELLCLDGGGGELLDGQLHARRRRRSSIDSGCRRCCGVGVVEMHVARSSRKDGVVLANGSVGAGMPRCAALAVDDLTRIDDLARLLLVAETFTGRVAVVLGRTTPRLVELRV